MHLYDHRSESRQVDAKGEVSEIGGWGGGIFNGGAWLEIADRRVDVQYRDLNVVEHEISEARQGRFHIEALMFHLAGVPSYLVVAELALNQVLRGELPSPDYPKALRETAPHDWLGRAEITLHYAEAAYTSGRKLTELAGAISTSAMMAAHAVLAVRGEWVTNEKRLLERAGLRDVDEIIAGLRAEPRSLENAINEAKRRFNGAVHEAM
ncbi:hypothetical protein QFZ30_001709 [Arthrobacter pascens]|uniref:nucleotidyltransferase domain-containing protein n=1 Tax=Arthrobacter pascens TaxID=1677 RepID=UPI00279233B2|nr:nucleotidyltransferase domain-containing protein [Arthrobacter pascens]MDQ0678327.1 hypothetical protein [Arthrobacter pascens]